MSGLFDILTQPRPEKKGMRPEIAMALMGLGQGMTQLGAGQPVNMAPMAAAIQNRGGSQFDKIMSDPRLKSALVAMHKTNPALAESIMMEAMFGVKVPQPPGPTDTMRNLEWRAQQAGLQPGSPEYADFFRTGGRNDGVTVNNLGNIPAGHQLFVDPETGAYQMRPIDGSPAHREMMAEQAAAEEAAAVAASANETKAQSADIVLSALNDAEKLVVSGTFLNPAVGFGTGIAENVRGSAASNYLEVIKPIEAGIGFDRLQKMRDESPTGGALGAINTAELDLLKGSIRSLANTQDPDQVLRHINTIRDVYTSIMRKAAAYPNAEKYGIIPPPDAGSSQGFTTYQQFAADPAMRDAAKAAGTSLETMWRIYQENAQ